MASHMNRAVRLGVALLCLISLAFAMAFAMRRRLSASSAPLDYRVEKLEFAPAGRPTGIRPIPRTIWSFWDGPRNELVDLCINSWRSLNPGYKVILLDKDSVRQYLPDFKPPHEGGSRQKYSDFLRVDLLATHGGVWVDATILCVEPLDEWIGSRSFCGFSIVFSGKETEFPVIENWFIASAPSDFMRHWKEMFFQLETGDVAANIREWERRGVDRQEIDVPYLAMHFAAQVVLQRRPKNTDMTLYRAEDTAFKYLTDTGWDSRRAVEGLADGTGPLPGRYAVKFRGEERGVIEGADVRTRDRLMRRLSDVVNDAVAQRQRRFLSMR